MKISIIIPNWNGRVLLEKNLPLVIAAKNNISEIIVVDDGSTDDSVKFLQDNFSKDIKLVKQKLNVGFSKTVNHGVRLAKGDLVCLLNTDVIPDKDFLIHVSPLFEDKQVFAISLHEKGFSYASGKFENGFIVHSPGKETNKTHISFWASGGSGVFRKSIWDKLNGFDEVNLSPFYWEDVDLGYRALKRGYKILWEPKAHVIHKHESVINKNNFRIWKLNLIKERNQLILIWKNLTSKNLFKKHRVGLFRRLKHHPGYIKVVFAALLKLPTILKARKVEAKEQVISDEAIFASFEK